jgi:SRSO17 transposase
MVEYAHRRAWVEQFHEEAKDLLGWDQYQGRLWPGFHRNAALVMLSYSFLVWWEWQERMRQVRRGRPRRDFPPRRDRRRTPLPAIHRQVADRLRELAMRESFIRQERSLLI